ncbi:MAG TPA: hypothetical protein VKK31_19035 [Thermoanaerobaculia bacterium]|nr:hypothetical protein [Thermoanaerobaculia bacterium]
MSKKKHPDAALLRDLMAVFEEHNWSGSAIGIGVSAGTSAKKCPAGKTPVDVRYQLPDGTWVNKTVCV